MLPGHVFTAQDAFELFSGIGTALGGIALVAYGELIGVAFAIEANTRKTADLLASSHRGETLPSEGREASVPEIPEGYKLSSSEAAHAIGVTRGTLQDYVKSGRINTNPDGTIDAAELIRAGFTIRNLPPRHG